MSSTAHWSLLLWNGKWSRKRKTLHSNQLNLKNSWPCITSCLCRMVAIYIYITQTHKHIYIYIYIKRILSLINKRLRNISDRTYISILVRIASILNQQRLATDNFLPMIPNQVLHTHDPIYHQGRLLGLYLVIRSYWLSHLVNLNGMQYYLGVCFYFIYDQHGWLGLLKWFASGR